MCVRACLASRDGKSVMRDDAGTRAHSSHEVFGIENAMPMVAASPLFPPLLRALSLILLTLIAGFELTSETRAADPVAVRIGYVRFAGSKQQPISLLDEALADDGLAGARLANHLGWGH